MFPLKVRRRVLSHLRYLAHWRCAEPVVVFESDDWGLPRRACPDLINSLGVPGEWAYEQMESQEDLEALYNLLCRFHDRHHRPACFTANFVVANPDIVAIENSGYTEYYDIPHVHETLLKEKWLEGINRQVFYPQYHGRAHFSIYAYLRDLQHDVPGARMLFSNHCFGGLSLLKGQGWRYHSEYLDWETGRSPSDEFLADWINQGVYYFQTLFQIFPFSTIAPHYIYTPQTLHAWSNKGIKFVQGAGYHITRKTDGTQSIRSHILGQRVGRNMLFLLRTVKFEPRPSRFLNQGLESAMRQIKRCFQANIPVVIDTHRINYTGVFRDTGLQQLEVLLNFLASRDVIFLTSVELGQAIENNGTYYDVWTGTTNHLTSLDSLFRQTTRAFFQRWLAAHIYI